MSIRQNIEDALKVTPKITLGELQKQLPDVKPGSLKAEFYRLKRKLVGPVTNKKPAPKKKKKSNNQKVSEYLNKNVETSIKTLQTAFPDIKQSSLSAYLSLWRKEQPKKDKPAAKKMDLEKSKAKLAKPEKKKEKLVKAKSETAKIVKSEKTVKQTAKPVKKTKLEKPTKKDNTELVESLKQTIAAQEKTIQTMNKSLDLSTPETNVEELKGMTLSEIKRIAVTFLKSIKELPAKMRR
jgi:hypothetical protein